MRDMRQHMPREQICFGGMGIARENESFDPFGLIGAQLGEHLVGIADDRRTAARTGAADPGPQVLLDKAVAVRRSAQRLLALNPEVLCIERLLADLAANVIYPWPAPLRWPTG